MAYGNNTEEEASEEKPEEEVTEAEAWVGDDLDSEEYGKVEVLEDGTRVAGEWIGVDFEDGTEAADYESEAIQSADQVSAQSQSADILNFQSADRFSQPEKLTTQQESSADYSALLTKLEFSETADKSSQNVYDFIELSAKLTTQRETDYEAKKWKRSRVKPGWLIKRIRGYNIVESEYGVQYLYVVSRKPDRTSADYSLYPFAMFCTWLALTDSGLLVKEKIRDRKQQRRG